MNDKKNPLFTIYTATYNRKGLLPRAYESVKKQTLRDFEWLIIDDGSTDGTDELIKQWQTEADFPIRYIWQANGGKHTAINKIGETCCGEFVTSVDSDDEMVPETLERFKFQWDRLSDKEKERVGGIICLSRDQDGNIVGDSFPKDRQIVDLMKMYLVTKIQGEKGGIVRAHFFKKYRYPDDVRNVYIPEEVFIQKMCKDWKALCINDILRVYWVDHRDDHDGDNMKKPKNYPGNRLLHLAYLNYSMRLFWQVPRVFFANAAYYIKTSLYLKIGLRRQWKEITTGSGRLLWLLMLPAGWFLYNKEK